MTLPSPCFPAGQMCANLGGEPSNHVLSERVLILLSHFLSPSHNLYISLSFLSFLVLSLLLFSPFLAAIFTCFYGFLPVILLSSSPPPSVALSLSLFLSLLAPHSLFPSHTPFLPVSHSVTHFYRFVNVEMCVRVCACGEPNCQ